jgi:tetratricopeptide (TPR) repeat protein
VGYLYNQVGEYDLGLSYADRIVSEDPTGRGICRSSHMRLEALYRSGRLRGNVAQFLNAVETCLQLGERLRANAIRAYVARSYIDQGRNRDAIKLLSEHYEEARASHYWRVICEYESLLATAYRNSGNRQAAQQFALRAAGDERNQGQYIEPIVNAYRLLYQLAQEQGDTKSALAYHEKYAAADKG